jgi:hypothetical protein
MSSEFQGLTRDNCSTGCNAERCIFSGKPYCAHPAKGGLQGVDLRNTDLVTRYHRARKALGLKLPIGQEEATAS